MRFEERFTKKLEFYNHTCANFPEIQPSARAVPRIVPRLRSAVGSSANFARVPCAIKMTAKIWVRKNRNLKKSSGNFQASRDQPTWWMVVRWSSLWHDCKNCAKMRKAGGKNYKHIIN